MTLNNSLIQKPTNQTSTFSAYLAQDAIKRRINEMVGGKEGQRFITAIIGVVSNNPAIAECDKTTILSSALLGEALKLSPSPQLGHYYIVPFNNTKKGIKEAQFQIGYKGYIQLAIRSGQYKNINVVAIKEGELVSYNPLTEELTTKFIEDDEAREKTPTMGYYAMFELTNGFKKSIYWSKKKMEAHALKYSMGYQAKKGYTFWEKDFDAMAFKTLLRQLLSKWGIMSIELQSAFEKDMGVIQEDGVVEYVDNSPQETNEEVLIREHSTESVAKPNIQADKEANTVDSHQSSQPAMSIDEELTAGF